VKRTCIDCGKRCQGTRCRSCYNAYCRTPEWRKKYSKIVKAAHARGAYDEMFASEEYRRKQSEAQKRPEVNRRRVAGIKAAYARGAYAGRDSEEYRQMQSEAHQRPEVKRKISAA
jgi:anti-sigma28 factor (negative regulator of flagellin synthesis)